MESIHKLKMDLCASISKLFMDPFTDPFIHYATEYADPNLVKLYKTFSTLHDTINIDNKLEELVVKPVLSTKHAWRSMALRDGPVMAQYLFEDRAALLADFVECEEMAEQEMGKDTDIEAQLLAMYSADFVDRPLRIWRRYVIMSDDLESCGDASAMSRLPAEVRSQILEAVLL
jgi:hypothetical protein